VVVAWANGPTENDNQREKNRARHTAKNVQSQSDLLTRPNGLEMSRPASQG